VSETRTDWAPGGDHPSIKLPAPQRVPHGVTLVGRLFEEGTMASAGIAMETAFAVAEKRPEGF
jgi:Asp-tRNA(Asn)/Glu-tRNA(Gln) amidotransferase A subunit family amidase